MLDHLNFYVTTPVKAQNAGLLISRGDTPHPTRRLDSHELLLVTQGSLEIWEDNQNFVIEAGQTLHLWPGREHGSNHLMPEDLRFYWIHFETSPIPPPPFPQDILAPEVSLPQVALLPRPEALERLFRIFLAEQENGTLHPLKANLLTMMMLSEVVQQSQERHQDESQNVVASWAQTYIRMNFDRAISAGNIAAALGYNVDYLGRIYRQTYHCTLTQAIHRHRIEVARKYLLDSNMTIEQIALSCGFTNSDYFRRIFKRHMKITPTDYRKENARVYVNTH